MNTSTENIVCVHRVYEKEAFWTAHVSCCSCCSSCASPRVRPDRHAWGAVHHYSAAPSTPKSLKIKVPKTETTVNLKSASFAVIMLLHEGWINIQSHIKPRLLFGESFALTSICVFLGWKSRHAAGGVPAEWATPASTAADLYRLVQLGLMKRLTAWPPLLLNHWPDELQIKTKFSLLAKMSDISHLQQPCCSRRKRLYRWLRWLAEHKQTRSHVKALPHNITAVESPHSDHEYFQPPTRRSTMEQNV